MTDGSVLMCAAGKRDKGGRYCVDTPETFPVGVAGFCSQRLVRGKGVKKCVKLRDKKLEVI